MKFAEVAVNIPLARPRTFTYALPSKVAVSVGCAVVVPFGVRRLQGVVFALSDESPVEETREIEEVIDPEPLLLPHQLQLARWMSERYLSSLFDAASLMLPPGFERRALTFVEPTADPGEDALSSLTPQQQKVVRFLQKGGRIELRELKKSLPLRGLRGIVGQLAHRGLLTQAMQLGRARIGPKLEYCVSAAIGVDQVQSEVDSLKRKNAHQQAELLRLLALEHAPLPLVHVKKELGFSPAVIEALKNKGLISIHKVRVHRDPLAERTFGKAIPPVLTPAQEAAWARIRERLQQSPRSALSRFFLLHGVTGSGKTEIYLQALAETISLGKRAIVMVPEIALTAQTISRFAGRFPGRVAVLHSKLSPGEHFDEWQRIREGEFDVVIGSRSALFAPQPELGLLVIDEEHEWTYKQHDKAPLYHARDVALKLADMVDALVIMGSATPDVESYRRAENGRYELLELPERVGQNGFTPPALPKVEIVDLRQELKQGNRSIFSRRLAGAMGRALASGEQVILFLNRRGSSSFVQCRDCGLVLRCRRCDLALTYHSEERSLICHQCNHRVLPPSVCPECGSQRIKYLGIGTQKVEEETSMTFPRARVLRWDRDVTRGRYAHEEILEKFQSHQADILIGTQMIAKGLDIPLVTLVGVINADVGLYLPDFRAGERTFQLLSQVGGRAGRGAWAGRVLIQTYAPDHYAIAAIPDHDYRAFYRQEIAFRHQYGNPPFNRLACLVYTHTNAARCQREAERMARLIRNEIDSQGLASTTLVGPSPAYAQRVRGRYRWQIIVRGPDPVEVLAPLVLPQDWTIDVDPVGLA